ncbi:methyltransferase domain-containing protein [Herbidospora sp. NEAU-GS84]|uniref:Methyltransferase domain-containing protein n=1 Tax=Herbidospora solisilvae TaxID=2696284 RepID=A0A7C9J1S4_9ACTN|nr:class I SAM-dependent methyltransferase [Herbidospora solisilvae]NAS22087.1 methyltransferase domain-containing protein [Herbidospora solisilvae]
MKQPHQWQDNQVVDVGPAEFASRMYREQTELRRYLRGLRGKGAMPRICDIGAGYGRISPVLQEFSPHVVAFERQKEFVLKGKALHPDVDFRHVNSLAHLPAEDEEFSFALTFTVLQHLADHNVVEAIREIRRVILPLGHVLLCEESDGDYVSGSYDDPEGLFTIGRSVETYQEWMEGFDLIETSPRPVEITYNRTDVGHFMLFRKHARM